MMIFFMFACKEEHLLGDVCSLFHILMHFFSFLLLLKSVGLGQILCQLGYANTTVFIFFGLSARNFMPCLGEDSVLSSK